MISDAQMSANRRNAKMSFGPVTKAGKAISSRNARTHWATSAARSAAVAKWYRVILSDPSASPSQLVSLDPEARLALALAVAEVQLQESRAALETHFSDCLTARRLFSLQDLDNQDLFEVIDRMFGPQTSRPQSSRTQGSRLDLNELARLIIRSEFTVWEQQAKRQGQLLRRYVREAESRRTRAFRAWVASCQERSDRWHTRVPSYRNEPILQP